MPVKFVAHQKRSRLLKSLKYIVSAKVLTFFGDIRYNGNMNFRIHANDIFRALEELKAGDVLLTRTDHTFSELAIPGFWSHAALYVGDGMVIEATSDGVVHHHIFDCLGHADHFCILRTSDNAGLKVDIDSVLARAISIVGRPYDFWFQDGDTEAFFCSEVVTYAYASTPGMLFISSDGKRVSPEDLYYNPQLVLIHENTRDGIK